MWWANPGWWGSPPIAALAGGGGTGPTGFTLVANVSAAGDYNAPPVTSGIDTTGATLLVVAISQYSGNSPHGLAADSRSNSWTALTAQSHPSAPYVQLFYCIGPSVGSGHTFTTTMPGSTIYGTVAVQAWKGGTGTPDVQNGSITNTPLTSWQIGSVTPSVSNSLIVAGISTSATTAYTIDSGFTRTDQIDPSAGHYMGVGLAYLVQGAAAAINPTWSWTTTGDAATAIATFKP